MFGIFEDPVVRVGSEGAAEFPRKEFAICADVIPVAVGTCWGA
jgi:hypothetical protein